MTDRLTQLQICVDQLIDQFCAALNYVDKYHDFVPEEGEQRMPDSQATIAEPEEFKITIDELTQDVIIKSRQIMTLISSLPGAGVSSEEQLIRIAELQEDLKKVEQEKEEAIKKKDELLLWCNELILQVSNGVAGSRIDN